METGVDNVSNKLVFEFDKIGVDSGLIMVGDISLAKKSNLKNKIIRVAKTADVENGTYKARLKIRKSWNGPVETRGIVKITTGKLVIGDPGYYIDKDWDSFISEFLEDDEGRFNGKLKEQSTKKAGIIIANNMGGDGVYDCILELEPLNK